MADNGLSAKDKADLAAIRKALPVGDPRIGKIDSLIGAEQAAAPKADRPGFFSSAADSSGLSMLGGVLRHPLDSIDNVLKAGGTVAKAALTNDRTQMDASQNPVISGIRSIGQNASSQLRDANIARKQGSYGAAAVHAGLAVPVLGQLAGRAMDQAADAGVSAPGNSYGQDLGKLVTDPGTMGTLVGGAAGLTTLPKLGEMGLNAAGGAQGLVALPGRAARGVLTAGSDLDKPILGTNTTPRARFQAAQRVGVNLDLADATNAPLPRALKAINQDSLLGSHVYENAKVGNKAALTDATDNALSSMSPLDRQTGGGALQELYQADQGRLLQQSRDGHGYIQANYGDTPLGPANASKLFSVADDIKAEQAAHNAQFPSLRPGKVAAIVDDASRFGKPDAPFAPDSTVGGIRTPPTQGYVSPNVGDALKARSGILDVYQNNPEIVKSSADAQLQRLVGGVHDSVMDSLPTDAQQTLRDAQLSYKEAKQVYDNPTSPLYSAVRTPNPENLVTGPSSQTPSALDNVMPRVGDTGRGIIQRGVAEKALGEAPGGGYNFQTFPRKLSAIPDDYASSLYGGKLSTLQDISDTSQALAKDLNPSGTAKQGQKLAEGGAALTGIGLPPVLGQYPLARFMNSPSVVNFAMRDALAPPATNLQVPTLLPSILTQTAVQANGTRGIQAVRLPMLQNPTQQ